MGSHCDQALGDLHVIGPVEGFCAVIEHVPVRVELVEVIFDEHDHRISVLPEAPVVAQIVARGLDQRSDATNAISLNRLLPRRGNCQVAPPPRVFCGFAGDHIYEFVVQQAVPRHSIGVDHGHDILPGGPRLGGIVA